MINKYIIKYILVGILNTIIGYGIIFYCMYLGIIAELSNFIGYFFGIILSFFLNKRWTFQSTNNFKKEFLKFIGSMYMAYIMNLIVLIISVRVFHINEYLAQILSGISYTITGYILSKKWVFKPKI